MMGHDVRAETIWWPNGAAGREITCRTCDWVLWQSPPESPYDASDQVLSRVTREHQAQMRVQVPDSPVRKKEKDKPSGSLDAGTSGDTEDAGDDRKPGDSS